MMKKGMLSLAFCIVSALLMAQDVLTIQTYVQQKKDTIELKIVFDVAPGMHVYAPSSLNQSQGYIVMKLEIDNIPEGLKLLPYQQWSEAALAGGGEVYTGKGHTIICKFLGNAKKSPAILKGILHYQACNEEICFPPQEKEFEATLQKRPTKDRRAGS